MVHYYKIGRGKMKFSFLKELKKVLIQAPKQYFLLITVSILIRALLLIIPIFFSGAIDFITASQYQSAVILILILMGITLIYRLFEGFYIVCYYKLYNKLYRFYSSLALSKTINNSLFSLSRFSTGEYANIAITDIDVISTFFTTGVIRMVQIIEFLVIYVYFLSLDIVLFISAVALSIVMLVIAIRYGDVLQKINERRKNALDNMTAGVYGFFNNIKEIKSYHIFDRLSNNNEKVTETYLNKNSNYSVHYNVSNHLFLYVFEAFRLLSVLYGLLLVQKGEFAVGTLLIIYNYYQKIIDNFTSILTTNVDYRNVVVSLNRFNRLVEYSKEEKQGIVLNKYEIQGSIQFDKILYGFKDNPTLKNASMRIPEKSLTVLSGRDDAAQNGIYDLLLKLNRQHEGTIQIDSYNINDIDDDSYYEIISCARRQSNLFDTTIKNNFIAINDNFDEVLEIAKKIGLDDKIRKLKDGYDTVLTDTTPISQNTRMLLIIVRCLLKHSKIILMDDIIDSLDQEHEKLVLGILEELKKDHTIVVISNSKELLSRADQVFDISNKKITSI